jgi:hypothetical protein
MKNDAVIQRTILALTQIWWLQWRVHRPISASPQRADLTDPPLAVPVGIMGHRALALLLDSLVSRVDLLSIEFEFHLNLAYRVLNMECPQLSRLHVPLGLGQLSAVAIRRGSRKPQPEWAVPSESPFRGP